MKITMKVNTLIVSILILSLALSPHTANAQTSTTTPSPTPNTSPTITPSPTPISSPTITPSPAPISSPTKTPSPTPIPPTQPISPTPTQVRSAAIHFGAFLTDPDPNKVAFDLYFSVLNINPGITAGEVYLSYDPAIVTPSNNSSAALGGFFESSGILTINEVLQASRCPGGLLPCLHLLVGGSTGQVTKDAAVMRFSFQGKVKGSACFSILSAKMANADGIQVIVLLPSTNPCVNVSTIATPLVSGTVLRQGTGGSNLANAFIGILPSQLSQIGEKSLASKLFDMLSAAGLRSLAGPSFFAIKRGGGGPVKVANTSNSGSFQFSIPNGTYTFFATYPGYLSSIKQVVLLNDPNNLGTTTLVGGDTNGDELINILDIGTVIGKWGQSNVVVGSTLPALEYYKDEPCDINDDGAINISDLAIIVGNWGLSGNRPW